MSTIYDHAVIGGGITGLVAAHTLNRKNSNVVIFEGASFGGCIQSKVVDGYTLELGANTLVLTPEIEKVLSELNLLSEVEPPAVHPFKQYVFHNNEVCVVPKSPVSLFKSPLFNLSEKLRMITGLFKKLPTEAVKNDSVEGLFSKLLGSAPVARIVEPALRGIFGGDIKKLDASALFPALFTHLANGQSLIRYAFSASKKGRKIFHLKGGNQRITDELAACLPKDSRIQQNVTSLEKNSDGSYQIKTSSGETFTAKRCIIATSGSASASFLGSLCPELVSLLQSIRYAPISVVHAAIPKSIPLPDKGFGVLFPSTSDAKIIGVLFNSILFPTTAPEGKSLITICHGGISTHGNPLPQNQALADTSKAELARFFNITNPEILSVYHWEKAIPQFEGTFRALQDAIESAEANNPGLSFIGCDRGGVGVPERVRWGSSVI